MTTERLSRPARAAPARDPPEPAAPARDAAAPPAAARFSAAGSGTATLRPGEAARLGSLLARSRAARDTETARLHADDAAAEAAEMLGAEAFTLGPDIYFAAGRYRPGTAGTRGILRHELAHVAQARATTATPPPGIPPPAAPPGPPPVPRAVAGPCHPLERAAAQGTTGGAAANRAPPGLILRLPSYLPPTAGGQALNRHLRSYPDDTYDEISQHIEAEDWDALREMDPRTRAEGEDPVERLREPVPEVLGQTSRISDPTVAQPMRTDLLGDLTTLVYENFYPEEDQPEQSYEDYDRQVGLVTAAYRNFVHLYVWETTHPAEHSPYRTPMPNWFRTRAEVFRLAAIRSLSPGELYSVLAALSADVIAAGAADPQGPVQSAEALIATLFENGIAQADMDAIRRLYTSVLSGIDVTLAEAQDPGEVTWRHEELKSDFVEVYLGPEVLAIEERLVREADADRLNNFRRQLAHEIAYYLATLRDLDFLEQTEVHLDSLAAILGPYQGPQFVIGYYENLWMPLDWDTEADDETAAETADQPAAPQRTTAPTPAPPPEPAPVCEGEEIGLDEIAAWLRMARGDRMGFTTRWADTAGLICANRPYTDTPGPAAVRGNLAAMTDAASAAMARLERHVTAARHRANDVFYARSGEGGPIYGPFLPGTEPPDPTESRTEPDYVAVLGYDDRFLDLFRSALNRDPTGYDTSHAIDRLDEALLAHFEALIYYQISLKAAVDLWQQLQSSGMAEFIRGLGVEDDAALIDRIQAYAENAETWPDWPDDTGPFDRGEEIDIAVLRMSGLRDLAQTDRDIENIEELQRVIFEQVPLAAQAKRTETIGAADDSAAHDHLRYSDIMPDPLAAMLPANWEDYREDARGAIEAALEFVNQARLVELSGYIREMAEMGDALRSEAAVRRFVDLRAAMQSGRGVRGGTADPDGADALRDVAERFGQDDVASQFLASVQLYNQGNTTSLLRIFMMAQSALNAAGGDLSGPGPVMRQLNLLMILLDRSRTKTVHGAVDELHAMSGTVGQVMFLQDPANRTALTAGSDVGLYDDIELFMGQTIFVQSLGGPMANVLGAAVRDLEASERDGVLKTILEAEAAGGFTARQPVLEGLADRLRAEGGSECLAVARFIYADILRVSHLVDELGLPTEVAAAQTRQNQRMTTMGLGMVGPRGAPMPSASDDRQTIEDYNEAQDNARTKLDRGVHPTDGHRLTSIERRIWRKRNAITGDDHWHGMGEEGWAKLGDFGKNVLKMVAILFVTRGIGGMAGSASGSMALQRGYSVATAARIGQAVSVGVNMTAFTFFTRVESTLSTGRYPHTSFAEDLIVNLATEGVGLGTQSLYRGLFGISGAAGQASLRHSIGIFAAEMATTTAATVIASGITSRIFNRPLTDAQLRDAMVQNAAMMVAMRGVHVMGQRASTYMMARFTDAATRRNVALGDLQTLQDQLRAEDAAMRDAASRMLDRTSDAERMEVLQEQLDAMNRKLDIMTRVSADPEMRMLAESYRRGIAAHERAVRQARLHLQINARAVGEHTADQTYSPGPASERALTEHFAQADLPYVIRPSRFGPVFVVTLRNGLKVRYRPRPEAGGGGTRRGSYSVSERLEGDEISVGDPEALMTILRADPFANELLRASVDNVVVVSAGLLPVQVTIRPVENFSTNRATHDAGPATYDIVYNATEARLEATIEVKVDNSNDQIVRAVNEELIEIQALSNALADASDGEVTRFAGQAGERRLRGVVERQSRAGLLGGDGTITELTADDIATVHGFGILGRKLGEINDRIEDSRTLESERPLLYARRALILRDFEALWAEARLPTDPAALGGVIDMLRDAGMTLDPTTEGYLRSMRFTQAARPVLDTPITMLDLHILFTELLKAMPNRFGGLTVRDFTNYYHTAIAERARRAYNEAIAEGRTHAEAADIQIATIIDLIGGLSTPSARGRFFEGLSVEDFNNNIQLVQQFGRMFGIDRNNFPDYDAVTVRGAANGYTRRTFDVVDASGRRITHLQLILPDGTVFFECHRGAGRTLRIVTHLSGYDIQLWSMKARNSLDTFNVLRTTGFHAAHGTGRLALSAEAAEALSTRVDYYDAEVARLRALGADKPGHAEYGTFRRMENWHRLLVRAQSRRQSGRTNRSMDALIRLLRVEELRPDDVDLIGD